MNVFAERAKNGIILTFQDPLEDKMYVWQSSEEDDYERWQEFLCEITDRFGPADSRYNEKRVYINVYPGDKWQGEFPDCPICGHKP